MKWEGPDDNSEQACWNSLLLEILVPECYATLLSRLALAGQESLQFWPVMAENACIYTDWNTCIKKTINKVLEKPCLTTMAGHVIAPRQKIAVYGGFGTQEERTTFKTFLEQLNEDECIVNLSTEGTKHVVKVFEDKDLGLDGCIIKPDTFAKICQRNLEILKVQADIPKMMFLKFLAANPANLPGLPLLPLRAGLWETFQLRPSSQFYLPTDDLESCIPNTFLNIVTVSDKALKDLADDWARSKQFGIERLSTTHLADILRKSLPASWLTDDKRSVDWDPSDEAQPSIRNLQEVWRQLSKANMNISGFEAIPLLPEKPFSKIESNHVLLLKLNPGLKFLDCSEVDLKILKILSL